MGIAQRKDTQKKEAVEDSKIFAYGATTNTNSSLLGGFVLRHSNAINVREGKTIHRYVALEVINVKHPKENTISNNFGNRVIFGKTNYLLSFRPEYGREWYLFSKSGDEGVGLSGILAAGPSIGLQKPYYIKYARPNLEQPVTVPYDPAIHTDLTRIVGSGNIWQGLFQNAKIIPGIHLKTALNLDMNTFGDNITGLEFGFVTEYFFKSPEIISETFVKNKSFYTSGFLTIYFGNKRIKK